MKMLGDRTIEELRKKHVLVVGMGYRTGLQVVNYLLRHGVEVSISDSKDRQNLESVLSNVEGSLQNIYLGWQSINQIDTIDLLVVSPGVPLNIPLIKEARSRNLEILSEIELAFMLSPEIKLIGITGTDGKSTTTTLVSKILETQYTVYMGGNIGIPFISFVDKLKDGDVVVLELSSYQLELVNTMRCNVATVLNINADHLDRYKALNDYARAKSNIFKNQLKSDYAILNNDDAYSQIYDKQVASEKLWFSRTNHTSDCYIKDTKVLFKDETVIEDINKANLKGIHNQENILAAITIAKLCGITNDNISDVVKNFRGLEHRTEYVGTVNGIDFINDSKATTINSVEKAISSQDRPILLILGGQDKGLDFSLLRSLVKKRTKHIIAYGSARKKIIEQLSLNNIIEAENLEIAFNICVEKGEAGDVVLLSPGCTSFDQYGSFEERGNHFKELFTKLKNTIK